MTSRPLIMAAVAIAAAIAMTAAALATLEQPAQAVVWGSVAFATYAVGLLCLIGGRHGRYLGLNRWRLGSWTALWYSIAFGLATLTWVQPQTESLGISQSTLPRALWLVAVGMTLWGLGYAVGPGQSARRAAKKAVAALNHRFEPEVRSPLAPWILYAVGNLARFAAAFTTGLYGYVGNVHSAVTTASGYQQLLATLALCAPLAVAAAALQVYRERTPGARVSLAVLFLSELAFGTATGNKQSYLVTILAVVIPFTAARRRLPLALLSLAAAVFLLIVLPFTHAYRGVVRGAQGILTTDQAVRAAPGILSQTISSVNVTGSVSSSMDSLLLRIREIDAPAITIQRTPGEIPFLNPVQLAEAPVAALIPRAIWPAKPILDPGYQFSQAYYDLPSTVYTSSAITPVADLYRHGGWIPVLAGMFILGCGVRLLDDAVDVNGNPHGIFLFLLLAPALVTQENDWTGIVAGVPGMLLIWVLAVYLTFRRSGRGSLSAASAPGRHRGSPSSQRK